MFKKLTRRGLDEFLKRNASTKHTLDIGAGGSTYDRFFPDRISIDIDPLRKPDIVADAHSLPFSDGQFESVLCTEVLEHVRNPKKVMSEITRVLSKGGQVILTTRFVYPIHDAPNDYWRYTKYALEHLFQDFDIVELVPESQSFTTIATLLQRICFQSTLRLNKCSKLALFFIAWLFAHADFLIVKEYGDIKKSAQEKDIMPTGYYIKALKK